MSDLRSRDARLLNLTTEKHEDESIFVETEIEIMEGELAGIKIRDTNAFVWIPEERRYRREVL